LAALLALACAAFITILTEVLPAGLLPMMSAGLGVSEATVGQMVSVYAFGSFATAIPLVAYSRGWRRRPLLLMALAGFMVVNTVTAFASNLALLLVARFGAGVCAGLVWGLLAGYASRLVVPGLRGRAIAVAMVGTPLALSLGLPAGTLLGHVLGWRTVFGLMSALTVGLMLWVRWTLPDFAGEAAQRQLPLRAVWRQRGVRPVLLATLLFVLAHNILYTYIAPFLQPAGLGRHLDQILLLFGVAAIVGIWLTGALIDRWLRRLTLASIALFGLAAIVLGLWGAQPWAVVAGVLAWGLAFGGSATLFQTASANAAGEAADVAQAMMVTVWNVGITGGAIVGGILLNTGGVALFPWAVVVLLAGAWCCAHRALR
jgi:predicted MFS family arabinose efflux permease